jgi:anti-anti-sigma regulatory factor
MTLRINATRSRQQAIFRLVGRIRAENLTDLRDHIAGAGRTVVLDLDEVTLVDVDAVRFLKSIENAGVEICNCPPFIREWIDREREKDE